MKSFKDATGRDWEIAINVDAIKRLKGSEVAINLLDLVNKESNLIQRFCSDPILLVDTLYVLCKVQADSKGISDEDFGRSMGGDALEHATTALLEEVANFFPQGKRQVLLRAIEKINQIQSTANQAAMKFLNSGAIDQELQQRLSEISGGLPASLESTLAPTPSENS